MALPASRCRRERCLFGTGLGFRSGVTGILVAVLLASNASCGPGTSSAAPAVIWDVTVSPPPLDHPREVTLPGNYLGETTFWAPCQGPSYNVTLGTDEDAIIRTTEVLKAPVLVYGGRNVRVIGLHIDLAEAPCATEGLSGFVPGAIALRLYQTGTSFVEGAYIDLAGRSADCIDPRNFIGGFDALDKGYGEAAARGERDVVILNTVCRGMSGDPQVHGDILQTQGGYELFRNVTFENVTADSNCEGTVLEPRAGYFLANSIVMRRFDYRMDSRYAPNPVAGQPGEYWNGGAVQHSAKSYTYDQVYLSRGQGSGEPPYEMAPTGTVRPSCNQGGIFCETVPATNRFASPGTGAASSAWTGVNYVSPWPANW